LAQHTKLCYRRNNSYNQTQFHQHKKFREPRKLEAGRDMANTGTPKFQNDMGVSVIEIGAHEFQCTGASAPFDHPHVFLDMGADDEIVCPYCSTLFRHSSALKAGEAMPPEAVFHD